SGLCSSTSNIVTVTVVPAITNADITGTQTVCEGITPSLLDGQTPSGAGPFTYTWQSSADGVSWTSISGATGEDYQPPVLTATTHYRRIVVNAPCADTSNVVIVTVNPNATGSISTTTNAICGNQSADITFTATTGTAPFNITYTISGPGGTSTVNQNGIANNATFTVIPAGSTAGNYTITLTSITNSNSCSTTTGLNSVAITVTAIPVITITQTPAGAICEGTSATLTASGATSYTWTGTGLSANTGSSVTANPTTTQTYTIDGTTNNCTGTTTYTLNVNPRPAPPTVVTPVNYCQNATGATPLQATASAGHTLTWYNNPGLTGGSASAPTPSTAVAGNFVWYVTQTNTGGCESQPDSITVTITPSIDNNVIGSNQTICSGSASAVLSAATPPTGGTGTFNYQWQSSPDGSSWTDIAGATAASYDAGSLPATTQFRRNITSGLCSNTSNVVTITVVPALTNTGISANQAICEGSTPAGLDGQTPAGAGPFTYTWQSSPDSSTWTNISGATGEDYQPGALTTTVFYRRIVVNGPCSDTSNVVKVTVNPKANGNITAPTAICQYESADITFTASAGTAPFEFNYTVTTPGGGSTTVYQAGMPSPSTVNVIPTGSAAGNYTVTLNSITNSNGCVTNTGLNSVTISVTATPVVTVDPVAAFCAGGSATLTANGATSYTWSPATYLSGTTGNTVTATPPAGTYTYDVQGTTNGCSGNGSITFTVNPKPTAPTVTTPVSYCQMGTASPLTGTGDPGNTITWYDNAALTGGVTTAPTPSTANGGTFTYYVTQTNSFGCESAPATITVNITPGVGGNAIGADQTICQGNAPAPLNNAGTLTGGNGSYTYQWQVSTDGVNWTDIPGATAISYSPGILNDTTYYRRNVSSGLCGSTSNTTTINVFEGLGNYNITADQTICEATAPALINGNTPTGSGTFTYTWEVSTDNVNWTAIPSSNTEDYQPASLTQTTYYRRKVTNGPCTATSNVVTITVNPLANGNITAPAAICEYEAASITFNATIGTGPFTIEYTISKPGGVTTASGPVSVNNGGTLNVIPTGSTPGSYTITLTSVTGSNGCARTAGLNSVNITVNPTPVVTIDPVAPICIGQSRNLIANGANSYAWTGSNLNSNSGSAVTATPGAAGTFTYSVTGTSLGCNSAPVSANLVVNPKPTASFTIADAEICLNEVASFTNTSTISTGSITDLYWDFDNGNLDTTGNISTPMSQGYSIHRIYNVRLKAVSDQGCVSDQFVAPLSVNPLPVASFDPPPFVCMPGGVAQFTNTSTIANNAALNYSWTFGDPGSGSLNTSTVKDGSHTYPDSASYDITLVVTSAQGCTHQVTESFNTFFNKPVAKFGVTPDTLCQGVQNAFFDSSFAPGSDIDERIWLFGDGTTGTGASPVKTYANPGHYQVRLQVSNTQGCSSEISKNIVVYLQPVVDVGPSFIVPIGTTVTFNAQTNSGALNLAWTSPTGGTLSDNTILKPTYIADQDGIFVLTATGDGNCSASDTLSVKVLRPITIPNAFSPNGDGINDTWSISNLADYPTAVVEVYNRYGQRVYRSFGYMKPWDGTVNGKELPVGTYYYIIEPKYGFPRVTGYVVIVK
ncbi:MAG TPA: PKD domain-containing protein, partial [Chitinophagaceae bacterium]